MTIKIKITTENTINVSNEKMEKFLNCFDQDELLELLKVSIVNQQKFKIRKLHLLAGAFSLVVIATVATLAVVLTSTTHPEHDEGSNRKVTHTKEMSGQFNSESVEDNGILNSESDSVLNKVGTRSSTVENDGIGSLLNSLTLENEIEKLRNALQAGKNVSEAEVTTKHPLIGTTINSQDGGNATLEIIGRQVWNASHITENYLPLIHPTDYVIVAHTGGRNCKSVEECSFVLRYIQEYHIKKGFGDIGYNFVIGGDGRVYVGRGWDSQGRHTKPFNSRSIGIAFAGTFTIELPSKRALKAAKLLLKTGVEIGKLSKNYTLYCQKQVINTESPGLKLIQELKTWDHWHVYDPLHEKPEYTSETTIFI